MPNRTYPDIHALINVTAQQYSASPSTSIETALQAWLSDQLRSLSDWLSSLIVYFQIGPNSNAIAYMGQLLLLLSGALCLFALLWIAWLRLNEVKSRYDLKRVGQAEVTHHLDSKEWLEHAFNLARCAKWDESCRSLYLSALNLFDEWNVAPLSPTRTNYEYFYGLAKYPTIQSLFRSLSEKVECFYFGGKLAGEKDYLSCQKLLSQIEEELLNHPTPEGHQNLVHTYKQKN